jgi:hypothetical protein
MPKPRSSKSIAVHVASATTAVVKYRPPPTTKSKNARRRQSRGGGGGKEEEEEEDGVTGSLDVLNRFTTVRLTPHQYAQPKRDASVQKVEAALLDSMLVRRADARDHLPYEHKMYSDEQVCRDVQNYFKPQTKADAWVWSRCVEWSEAHLTED